MKRELAVLLLLCMAVVGMAGAANYMYEKANVKGVGYKNVETIIQTQPGLNGNKLVEKESGSGNVITERTEIEAERDPIGPWCCWDECGSDYFASPPGECIIEGWNDPCCCVDYINFNKEAEFEYMPVSYQTGTYDQKWIEKLCVQNYYIGAVVVEMYTHAEHLQKNTEVKTRRDCNSWRPLPLQPPLPPLPPDPPLPPLPPEPQGENNNIAYCGADGCYGCGDCTGALEANFNSNVIGVAHIGWLSKDVSVNCKGRHYEWGRSVEDLTGVFSIEKFIQLWGNGTCGEVRVDWLPCI